MATRPASHVTTFPQRPRPHGYLFQLYEKLTATAPRDGGPGFMPGPGRGGVSPRVKKFFVGDFFKRPAEHA